MAEFTIIDRVLNMYHIIYSARSLYKLMRTIINFFYHNDTTAFKIFK